MFSASLFPVGCLFAQKTLSSEHASLGMSTTGPVGFIVITLSLFPLTSLLFVTCGWPRVTDECRVFFSTPLPEGEPKGDPKGDDGKWTHLPFLLLSPFLSHYLHDRGEPSHRLLSQSLIRPQIVNVLVTHCGFYFQVRQENPWLTWG